MILDLAREHIADIMTIPPYLSGLQSASSILDTSNYTIMAVSFGKDGDGFRNHAHKSVFRDYEDTLEIPPAYENYLGVVSYSNNLNILEVLSSDDSLSAYGPARFDFPTLEQIDISYLTGTSIYVTATDVCGTVTGSYQVTGDILYLDSHQVTSIFNGLASNKIISEIKGNFTTIYTSSIGPDVTLELDDDANKAVIDLIIGSDLGYIVTGTSENPGRDTKLNNLSIVKDTTNPGNTYYPLDEIFITGTYADGEFFEYTSIYVPGATDKLSFFFIPIAPTVRQINPDKLGFGLSSDPQGGLVITINEKGFPGVGNEANLIFSVFDSPDNDGAGLNWPKFNVTTQGDDNALSGYDSYGTASALDLYYKLLPSDPKPTDTRLEEANCIPYIVSSSESVDFTIPLNGLGINYDLGHYLNYAQNIKSLTPSLYISSLWTDGGTFIPSALDASFVIYAKDPGDNFEENQIMSGILKPGFNTYGTVDENGFLTFMDGEALTGTLDTLYDKLSECKAFRRIETDTSNTCMHVSFLIPSGDAGAMYLFGGLYSIGLWTLDIKEMLKNGENPPYNFSINNNPRKYKLFSKYISSRDLLYVNNKSFEGNQEAAMHLFMNATEYGGFPLGFRFDIKLKFS